MKKHLLNAETFYDQFTPDYDPMIRFEERLKNEQPVFEHLFNQYPVNTVLDAACGTGIHVIMLNRMGIITSGADISANMLKKARENCRKYKSIADLYLSPMQELDKNINDTYDAIICLGNSLPHILDPDDLKQTITAFYSLLNPGGHLILGMLNFERVRLKNERILSINREGKKEYIRFYDIDEDTVNFNILTIDWQNEQATHHLQTTELMPYSKDLLDIRLQEAGFSKNKYKGSLRLDTFNHVESKNLVVISQKT